VTREFAAKNTNILMAQILPIQPSLNQLMPSPAPMPPRYPEEQDGIPIAALFAMMRRHWLLMLVVVALSLAAAFAITRLMRPVYRASTTLYFAEHESTVPALDILNQIENGNSEVATEMEVMRSRALAETVIDSLGLQATVVEPRDASTSKFINVVHANPGGPEATFAFSKSGDSAYAVENLTSGARLGTAQAGVPFTFGGITAVVVSAALRHRQFNVHVESRELAVKALFDNMKVARPNATASVVQVSYTSHDPARARAVPDVLAKTYLAWRSSLRKSGDRSTVEFLKEQIDTIAGQLYAAEEALRRFRQDNRVVDLPTQATTQVQRLATLEAAQADVDMQRAALKNLMREVKSAPSDPRVGSPYRRLMAFPSLMTVANPALPLLQTLTSLEQRRADLLVRRTPADPDVAALTQSIGDVETQIAAVVDTYVKGLDEQSASLSVQAGAFSGQAAQVPRKEVEYARLDRTETGLTQIYTMLQTRLREAQIAEAVDDGAVRVVDPAATPTLPVSPRPLLNMLVGALLGLFGAFVAVLIRERLDHTIHTKEDVEAVSGAAVLALIPHISSDEQAKAFKRWGSTWSRKLLGNRRALPHREETAKLLLKDPQGVASEAFRKLRTNITFARPDSPPRVLVFTSPAAGDGKSTSVMNLAIALVQQGKKVLIIDADMRRGGLHKMVKATQTPGLSEIIVGQAELENVIQSLRMEPFGSIDLISTGVIPPNPAELLASPRFRGLVENLRPSYDTVLIDSPPINLVTDASIIGRETDGAVFVVRAAKSTRGEILHAVDQLRQVQIPVTGVVLNDYNARRDAAYNGAYHYGYSYDYQPYGRRT
jgi:capsular exopolysaccharide synthesis family protein